MPLAFESLNHGTVAFGFFNIETDMLLLEQYFLFGSEFCKNVCDMAENASKEKHEARWAVYRIGKRSQIGDLTGAIHGVRYTGFIGELYRKYPFPTEPEAFRQKPDGYLSQAVVRGIIAHYGKQVLLPVTANQRTFEVDIGEYKFSRKTFRELIKYVWRGGYPRWRDAIRPDYVLEMKTKIETHCQGLFENIQLD